MNTAVFAMADRVLFRPLPFDRPERLVTVYAFNASSGQVFFSFPKAVAVEAKKSAAAVDDIAYAGRSRSFFVNGVDGSALRLVDASYNVLDVLRVQPVFGRGFTRQDAAEQLKLVLLRYESWTTRFNSDRSVFGRQLSDQSVTLQIVGVLPPGFIVPSVNWAAPSDGLLLSPDLLVSAAGGESIPGLFGRLRDDGNATVLQQQLDALVPVLQHERRAEARTSIVVKPMREGIFWNIRAQLLILFVGGTLVWLVACANLSVLMAVRTQSLQREVAIRASLGASRFRIVTLLLTESATLCILGSLIAIICLGWSLSTLAAIVPAFFQPLLVESVDGRLVTFVVLLSGLGTLLACVYPAWCAVNLDQRNVLRRAGVSGPQHRGGRRSLLALETALGTALVLAGSFAIRSLIGLLNTDLGFDPKGLYVASLHLPAVVRAGAVPPPEPKLGATKPEPKNKILESEPPLESGPKLIAESGREASAIASRATEVIQAVPGVVAVSGVDVAAVGGESAVLVLDRDGNQVARRSILENYFSVMRTRIVAGRGFFRAEVLSGAPVAILSSSAVQLLWPGTNVATALGRTVSFEDDSPRQVVGVVADTRVRQASLVQPELFIPADEQNVFLRSFVVRASDIAGIDAGLLRESLRREFGSSTRIMFSSVAQQLEPWLQDPKLYAALFGAFGVVAMILSAIGLFAVSSFDASLRRYELGVRLALGAEAKHIERMLILDSVKPVVIGLALGYTISHWAGQAFQALLYRVDVRDPTMYGLVAIVLFGAAVAAAWRPARVAGQASPLDTIRAE